jgi:hypothetical protein
MDNENLCATSVLLCVSVVGLDWKEFTTETQSSTEDAQRREQYVFSRETLGAKNRLAHEGCFIKFVNR